jgi:hypothetical protein
MKKMDQSTTELKVMKEELAKANTLTCLALDAIEENWKVSYIFFQHQAIYTESQQHIEWILVEMNLRKMELWLEEMKWEILWTEEIWETKRSVSHRFKSLFMSTL